MTQIMLAPHFSLGEMQHTSHQNIVNQAHPDAVERMRNLASNYLEPGRNEFGPFVVSSGFRNRRLNRIVGGQKDSAHLYGCAADIIPWDEAVSISDITAWYAASDLDFDQVIDELSPNGDAWCHIGILRPNHEPKPRRVVLMKRNGIYLPFDRNKAQA